MFVRPDQGQADGGAAEGALALADLPLLLDEDPAKAANPPFQVFDHPGTFAG
jgi:hypothetical protein